MLLSENDISIDTHFMGPGHGSRHVLRCDAIGFSKELDGNDLLKSRRKALSELETIVFEKFRSGSFAFQSSERHAKAIVLVDLPDDKLIDQIYVKDSFQQEIVRREIIRRGFMDEGIYQIGKFGNELAREQAIQLLKEHATEVTRSP